ncbi:conserved protein of unknown function [Georgfuchsia toluolica]|uniref:Methyl-accepting transducer domain-containing protein n=1 Tax=Georgfuchsia toluolica TaxID=424218 RepID=A0A916J1M0_9PROT|nr:methyl-accepting chemotaxis protein [Georgfuchsia toluolica]CAG4882151.1 conserved protein of unknown function [Georgfuchsia toluolica]
MFGISVSKRWEKIGLQLKLQLLIQGFLIIILVLTQLGITNQFENQVMSTAEERAIAVADGAINGLNVLMITQTGQGAIISDRKARATFIEKMAASDKVKEIRVIRSKQLETAYPPDLPQAAPVDEMDHRILTSGKREAKLIRNGDEVWLRVMIPFIATKNFRTINCVECHGVNEGTVLGAASVTIDVKDDWATARNIAIWGWIGQGMLQIILFFFIGLIVRRLLSQLGGEPAYVINIVRQIAKGDLSKSIITRSGDSSSMLCAMKQMQVNLRNIIEGIVLSADQLVQSAQQLTSSSRQVLKASERQNDASASAAASIEEMTACISQISENSSDAQKHAAETGSLAKEGSNVVQGVIVEMDKISEAVTNSSAEVTSLGEQSHKISSIVNVINEIADQTNLLALNAAIEAARAGEQGRGFAVVADEVRKLAERTARSTQEIASMIQTIQDGTSDAVKGMSIGNERVNQGVRMVGHTGSSMEKIQEGVEKVLVAVSEISSSLREQSSTSNLIAQNIEGIAQMTEETSTTVREVFTAADHLEELAGKLKHSVDQFKL